MITINNNLFSTKVKVFIIDPYLGILRILKKHLYETFDRTDAHQFHIRRRAGL